MMIWTLRRTTKPMRICTDLEAMDSDAPQPRFLTVQSIYSAGIRFVLRIPFNSRVLCLRETASVRCLL